MLLIFLSLKFEGNAYLILGKGILRKGEVKGSEEKLILKIKILKQRKGQTDTNN